MNFFASVFSDSDNAHQNESQEEANRDSSLLERRSDSTGAGAWEIGGLWKRLSAKSELIIETYRRDLQEFGTGLKKEIEVAQGSLETVGHVVDQFGNSVAKGTARFISHGKDAIPVNSGSENNVNTKNKHCTEKEGFNSRRYSRFEAQVQAIQGDVSTYSEVAEDLEGYEKWKSGFSLEGKSEEMEGLLRENEGMESVYKRVVPNVVDRDTFWFRYYYRVYRFKKAEDMRARLVRRMSREEEELSWDVEDDDDDEHSDENNKRKEENSSGTEKSTVEQMYKSFEDGSKEGKRGDLLHRRGSGDKKDEPVGESKVDKSSKEMGDGSKKKEDAVDDTVNMNDCAVDSDKKMVMEQTIDNGKDSSVEKEEYLEWDEIEDLSGIDEEKATQTGSPTKVDLRKRLSTAQQQQQEEDLSWDIEDDDDDKPPNAKV
ncbi:BSD domain-containing protein C22A12.14c-like [Vigna unguiculata]|uniref:BSD domain-containing protein C22A12.14c-like n=1 Tax=Vigna unguiculata TaxID=3917 RepID=UPI00101639C6|nr:BSD domain-containing protein C22A12.14c-like [Vigna unguiculata]